MDDAHRLFDCAMHVDVVLCNALILGYVHNGDGGAALHVFSAASRIVSPTARTFAAALQACSCQAVAASRQADDDAKLEALHTGSRIHSWIIASIPLDPFLCAALIDMYSKCGAMERARQVFDTMAGFQRDVVCWTTLLLGYADNGQSMAALELLETMTRDAGCRPNARTLVAAIKACSALVEDCGGDDNKLAALDKGMAVHSLAAALGFESDKFVAGALVHMYAKCGAVVFARDVLDRMVRVDAVAVTGMMLAYANDAQGEAALELLSPTIQLDPPTFIAAIKACIDLAGREDHTDFGGVLVKPVSLERGLWIHSVAARIAGVTRNKAVASSLLGMYARCGSMVDARRVFDEARARGNDSTALWNALILGYADLRYDTEALDLLGRMPCPVNGRTLVAALKAVAKASGQSCNDPELTMVCLERGMAIHRHALRQHDVVDDLFVGNALVEMFAKCGSLTDARRAFDSMQQHDAVSWNTLISAYTDHGDVESAIAALSHVSRPDARTFIALLKACGTCARYQAGRSVHANVCRNGEEGDGAVMTCLVEFYGRCGSMEHARRVFDGAAAVAAASIQAGNALIAGYSRQGDYKSGMELFHEMQEAGCEPNGVTYLALLTVCNHAGLVDLAIKLLARMREKLGTKVRPEHRNCFVDVFTRAGQGDA